MGYNSAFTCITPLHLLLIAGLYLLSLECIPCTRAYPSVQFLSIHLRFLCFQCNINESVILETGRLMKSLGLIVSRLLGFHASEQDH